MPKKMSKMPSVGLTNKHRVRSYIIKLRLFSVNKKET